MDFRRESVDETPVAAGVEARSRAKQPRDRDRDEEGQTLLEFALVLPVLLIIVLGLIVFGIALNNYMVLTNATNVSAQTLSTTRGQSTDPCGTTVQAFNSAAPNLAQNNLKFTIALNGSDVGGTSCPSAVLVAGQTAQVTVTYPCNLSFSGLNFAPKGCILTAQTANEIQ